MAQNQKQKNNFYLKQSFSYKRDKTVGILEGEIIQKNGSRTLLRLPSGNQINFLNSSVTYEGSHGWEFLNSKQSNCLCEKTLKKLRLLKSVLQLKKSLKKEFKRHATK